MAAKIVNQNIQLYLSKDVLNLNRYAEFSVPTLDFPRSISDQI